MWRHFVPLQATLPPVKYSVASISGADNPITAPTLVGDLLGGRRCELMSVGINSGFAITGTAKNQSQASPVGETKRRPYDCGSGGSSVQPLGTSDRNGISASRAVAGGLA